MTIENADDASKIFEQQTNDAVRSAVKKVLEGITKAAKEGRRSTSLTLDKLILPFEEAIRADLEARGFIVERREGAFDYRGTWPPSFTISF